MNNKVKHLEMIEAIIARLANNSYTLKGWAITLVVGIITLSSKDHNRLYMVVAYIPLIAFWLLSSYYLYIENLYTILYNGVRVKKEEEIDFDMSTKHIGHKKKIFAESIFSLSQLLFYGSSIIFLTLALLVAGTFDPVVVPKVT